MALRHARILPKPTGTLAELKAHIVRQRLILGRTLAEGRRLLVAKSTLQALEGSLHIFGSIVSCAVNQRRKQKALRHALAAVRRHRATSRADTAVIA
jgi:hypothetical protein